MSSRRADTDFPRSVATRARKVSTYERLKRAILEGEIPPGEPMVEQTLARWCGVSRTPIREALVRLEQDGLVSRGEHGLVVQESSPAEILDLYETRIVLESMAATVAAERRTSHDLLAMRRAAAVAEGRFTNLDAVSTNRDFHRAVWRATHNESLVDLLERLNMHLGRFPMSTLAYPGRLETAHTQHLALVEAIEARDAAAASKIANEHFMEARDIRLRIWDAE